MVIINLNFILGNQITCGRIEPQFCKELCPLQHKLPYKNTPTKTPQPTHPRKLLQLDHQQQKDLEPNKINMKIDVVI